MDTATALDIVTKAVIALGHERINPESLEALQNAAHEWGWQSINHGVGENVHAAYNVVMAGFRAMFATA